MITEAHGQASRSERGDGGPPISPSAPPTDTHTEATNGGPSAHIRPRNIPFQYMSGKA